MSFDLSAKLFYGFELSANYEAPDELREKVYDGKYDDWDGNKTGSPCVTVRVGWHETTHAVAIRGTTVTARHGELAAFEFAEVDPAWDEQLRQWCVENGFKPGVPSWMLGARYA